MENIDLLADDFNLEQAEKFSDLFEQDSRRFSNLFIEEQEVSSI